MKCERERAVDGVTDRAESGAVRCANPRCRSSGDANPVYGRDVICEWCTDRLEGHLGQLVWLHKDLESALAAGSTSARFERVSGSRTPPAPVRLDVADHRDHIQALLGSWSLLVIDQRHLRSIPDNDPRDLTEFLATHLEWLKSHPAAGDLCSEVSAALGRGRRLLEPPSAMVLVPCPDVLGTGCEGRIPVSVEARSVWCAECGFETDSLPWLGRLLRERGDIANSPLVTAVDACHRLRAEGIEVKPGTIRTWVSRKKVAPRDRDAAGRVLYDMDELRRTAQTSQRYNGSRSLSAVNAR